MFRADTFRSSYGDTVLSSGSCADLSVVTDTVWTFRIRPFIPGGETNDHILVLPDKFIDLESRRREAIWSLTPVLVNAKAPRVGVDPSMIMVVRWLEQVVQVCW